MIYLALHGFFFACMIYTGYIISGHIMSCNKDQVVGRRVEVLILWLLIFDFLYTQFQKLIAQGYFFSQF